MISTGVSPAFSQANSELKNYFSQKLGLSQDQIAAIRSGQPFAKALDPRTPAEIFVFGAVYINAVPESYLNFASDFDRLRKTPGYLAIMRFGDPPQLSDLKGFGFDSEDIKQLKDCKPADCVVQLPADRMEELRKSVDWSAPNVDEQVNQFVQKLALQRLLTYR